MYGLMNLRPLPGNQGGKSKALGRAAEASWNEFASPLTRMLSSTGILWWFNLANYPILYFKKKGAVLQLEKCKAIWGIREWQTSWGTSERNNSIRANLSRPAFSGSSSGTQRWGHPECVAGFSFVCLFVCFAPSIIVHFQPTCQISMALQQCLSCVSLD